MIGMICSSKESAQIYGYSFLQANNESIRSH